jgi:uncharacterized protein YqjF (DUF2071 family)
MLNYAVNPALLERFIPRGTEFDEHEGQTYVSLIGFEFNRTRILGRAVPFHQAFEEVNLRFYVRRGTRRGVVFIRELVPKVAVTAVARLAYGENYSCAPMSHRVDFGTEKVYAEFAWGMGAAKCSISAEIRDESYLPEDGSLPQFITEHYWGYATRAESTIEYQVDHPQWRVRDALTARCQGNAEKYYGREFADLLAGAPQSAFLAEGSDVTVFRGLPIE